MEREGAGGVGDLVGKAEARVVRGASQVIRGLSIGSQGLELKAVVNAGNQTWILCESSERSELPSSKCLFSSWWHYFGKDWR